MDELYKLINELMEASKQGQEARGHAPTDTLNDRLCLQLAEDGWEHTKFEYVSDSNDIITYWEKDEKEMQVHLTFLQQGRWIRAIRQLDKEKNNEQ